MASALIKHTSDASFEADVLQSDKPVLLDFWAEWCGPCRSIAPALDELAAAYEGKLQIVKMNIDENTATPARFGIRGIPTLMVFKNGQLVATKVGAMTKAQMTALIDRYVLFQAFSPFQRHALGNGACLFVCVFKRAFPAIIRRLPAGHVRHTAGLGQGGAFMPQPAAGATAAAPADFIQLSSRTFFPFPFFPATHAACALRG